jgi:hypothetical protein
MQLWKFRDRDLNLQFLDESIGPSNILLIWRVLSAHQRLSGREEDNSICTYCAITFVVNFLRKLGSEQMPTYYTGYLEECRMAYYIIRIKM